MLDMNLVATMLMGVGLVGAAALAIWQLPWSEADLLQADVDARAAVARTVEGARPVPARVGLLR